MRLRYQRRMKLDYLKGEGFQYSGYRKHGGYWQRSKQIHEVENKMKDSQPRKAPKLSVYGPVCVLADRSGRWG
jgi:hypothetical protein